MKKIIFIVGMLTFSLVFASVSYANVESCQMQVGATVIGVCTISTTNMDFGSVTGQTEVDAQAQITINCQDGIPYHIALNAGQHYDGTVRRVTDNTVTYFASYVLVKADHTTQWGDSDYANTFHQGSSHPGIGSGSNQSLIVFGTLSSFSGIPAGTVLTDTVNVTVHY